jgi:serine protease inhibitor
VCGSSCRRAPADGYDELLGRWFGAGVEPLPLRTDSDSSQQRINDWLEDRTEGLIPDLLTDGFLGPHSVLVLVNALSLEADWARPFGRYRTAPNTSTRLDDTTASSGSVELYLPRFESTSDLDLRRATMSD